MARPRLMAGVMLAAAAAGPATAGSYLGKPFPNFTAVDAITGEVVSIEGLRGKAVVIDFWATWCGPCRRELPHVKRAYEEFRDDGLEIVGISLDNSEPKFRTFVEKSAMNWVQVMEGGGFRTRLATKYGISSIPRVFVLDRNGVCISERARGHNLEVAIRKALAVTAEGSAPIDPVTNRQMSRLAAAQYAVQRTVPPLDAVSKRLAAIQTSLAFNPDHASDRVVVALTRRRAMLRETLVRSRLSLHRIGVVDQAQDPDLAGDPPDIVRMRAAAERMIAACEAAREQLAVVDDGLGSLRQDVISGSKSPEMLDREIGEMHDHAMQLAATWCSPR